MLYHRTLCVCLFVVAAIASAVARDLAVVSNRANVVTTLALPDFVKVCKGQTRNWPDGKSVTLIMRAPSSPEMKLVLEKIYLIPESDVKALISAANHGRNGHPAIIIADSDDELVSKVASLPGAIGIVDVYSINSSVAVLRLAGKLPLEPGYVLHGN